MKFIVTSIAILTFLITTAQKPNLAKEFQPGSVTLLDSTVVKGEVKWFPHQNEKLRFRTTDGKTEKYAPDEILGFHADTAEYRSLFNFEVVGGSFLLQGKYNTVKSSFARYLGGERFEVYLVPITGVSATGLGVMNYINLLFRDTKNPAAAMVPYPVLVPMKDKKLEKAREPLVPFFADFPAIVEKLKSIGLGEELDFAKEVILLR